MIGVYAGIFAFCPGTGGDKSAGCVGGQIAVSSGACGGIGRNVGASGATACDTTVAEGAGSAAGAVIRAAVKRICQGVYAYSGTRSWEIGVADLS